MKKLLFVLLALMAAMLVIGVTTALTRSGEAEPTDPTEDPAAE